MIMPYVAAVNPRGYSNTRSHSHRHYSAAQTGSQIDYSSSPFAPPRRETAQQSQPLPNHSMAVDYPVDVNMYDQCSRDPTPHSGSTTDTPPRANPPYTTLHPNLRTAHTYAETEITSHWQMPDHSMHASLRTPNKANRYPPAPHMGDIPPYQLPHQRGVASQAQTEGFLRDTQTHDNSSVSPPHAIVGSSTPLSGGPHILQPTRHSLPCVWERNDRHTVCLSNYNLILTHNKP